ncbi:hypothetical protein HNY73_004421 [Argiope bruennichi]|uniref:Uncharacterized protein n=1 Tax=Argiope bruennichi TaxID=94029 RepID=A0A8T0FNX3_ARGBR|nr:hypothetical protein HNY73_004421 [Argiope bruennichi]
MPLPLSRLAAPFKGRIWDFKISFLNSTSTEEPLPKTWKSVRPLNMMYSRHSNLRWNGGLFSGHLNGEQRVLIQSNH